MNGNKRPALASLFEKVESYIRALETLSEKPDKCAAILYPLVKSSLLERFLRAWQVRAQRVGAGRINRS